MFFLKELPTLEIMRRYEAQYPEMNLERTVEALAMLRMASALIRRLDLYFQDYGLSQTRFLVLLVLDRDPNRRSYTAAALLERIDVSKPVMGQVLRGLESDDLIEVIASSTDGRAKNIAITPAGQDLLHRVLPGYFRLLDEHMAAHESPRDRRRQRNHPTKSASS